MASFLSQVVEALKQGASLVGAQDDQVRDYIRQFVENDPAGLDPPRPVLAWDAEDGFRPCSPYNDPLPEVRDLADALDFPKGYRGGAIFVFDCGQVDLAGQAETLRKRFKQLADRLTVGGGRVTVVLLSPQPLPASLVNTLTWIGATASVAKEAGPPVAVKGDYAALRNLDEFDTPEWQERLERLSSKEAAEIVRSNAYRESLDRVNEVRKRLKERFARKDDIIDALFAASVAQVPTVLIGPPGTAKGNIIRCLCEGLGLSSQKEMDKPSVNGTGGRKYFEYLLTRYTTPEEIFGPIHVQDLIDKQTYRRVTVGYLPEAQVAFLDEIFKASSAILNTLLTILNERIFYNAGRAQRVPLVMVFAASNEAPADETLAALYDRFPLRVNCPPVEDDFLPDLLRLGWEQAYERQFAGGTAVPRIACANDLRLLHHVMRVAYGGRQIKQSAGSGDFADEFLRAFRSLRTECSISDRTMVLLLAYARAHALLNGRSRLTVDELDVFRHVTWDETGEVDRMVKNIKRGYRA